MEYAPLGPESSHAEKKTPPIEPPERDRGVLDRWLRRDKKPEQKTETPTIKPETGPALEIKKTRSQRFAQGILRLFGRGETAEPPHRISQTHPVAERPGLTETAPLVEQAGRIRRFANVVINRVLGVAEQEHERVKATGKPPEQPIDTEPLIEAAGDLRQAVHELEQAMPETVSAASEAAETPHDSYDASPDSSAAGWVTPETLPPRVSQLVAERVTQRVQQLEQRLEEESGKNSLTAAAVAAGIGVVAVAGVLLLGHEYLSHRKIKREQRDIKKEQRKQQDTQTAQEAAFSRLQQAQTADMARRERQEYFQQLSEFTHHQADVTRSTAHELQQAHHEPIETAALHQSNSTPGVQPQTATMAERTPGVVNQNAELAAEPRIERPAPIVAVESADRVEKGQSVAQSASKHDTAGGGDSSDGSGGLSSGQPAEPQTSLSPTIQRQQAAQKARAARLASNAWLYGALLIIAAIAVVIWMWVF